MALRFQGVSHEGFYALCGMFSAELAIIRNVMTLENRWRKRLDDVSSFRCPRCGSNQLGRLGASLFYCWGCYAEIVRGPSAILVYELAADGSRASVASYELKGAGVG